MALVVWLPLNGNLNNQGASAYTISSIETTPTFTTGKIGQCYQRANSNAQLTNGLKIEDNLVSTLGTTASIAVWVKPLGTHTHYNGTIMSSGDWNRQKWAFGVSQDNSKVDVLCGGYNNYITCAVPTNEWTHLVSTFDNGICKLYKNGVYVGQLTGQAAFVSDATWTGICRESYASGYFGFNGCINDLRLYNHCLSAAEVKEISQGLVLHYKLDDIYAETTTNLYSGTFSNTCFNGAISKYNYGTTTDMYKTTGTFQGRESVKVYMGTAGLDAYPYVYFDAFNTKGAEVHTLSFDYFPTSQTTLIPYSYNGTYNISYTTSNGAHDSQTNISQIIIPVVINQWNHISITMQKYDTTNTNRGNGYIRIGSAKHTSTTTDYWLFTNIQVEAKDHETGYTSPGTTRSNVQIQDSSGYGNNGTINSSLTISSETMRYSSSIMFDGVDDCITVPYNAICPENIFTINLWFKKDALGSKNYETLFGGPSGFEMDTRAGSATSLSLYMASTRSTNRNLVTPLSLNNWYMITMTRDGTKEKYYVNGIYQSEIDAKAMPTDIYRIGAWASNTGQNYYGLISDFRIYNTPLSADDILQLYHTSAKVDNQKNWHSFEFIDGTKEIITKHGQTIGHNIIETYLPLYDKTIYTEPDGSTWIHIFHHNNPANSKFTSPETDWLLGKYIDTDKWYDVDQAILSSLGPYEFMFKQKTTSSSTEAKYRWIQTANPLTAVWADVKPGTPTFITTAGYTTSSMGGLYIFKNSNLHMCIANSSNGNWYGGIGCAAVYNGGIPGYPNTTVTDGYIDLYIRIYDNAKIIKDIGINAHEFIEL